MKKRKTIYSRLVRMVVIVDCMMIFLLFCGYTTVGNVIASDHPEEYFKNYRIFCIAVIIVFAIVLTLIFQRIMKTIRVGFRQITEATRDMASGKIDIDIPLDGTDEFGDLFREYKLLIDASREQALLAEEVANEDLTKEIIPRSDDDVLGRALQKMVYENNNSLGKIRDSVQIVYDKTNEVSAASNNLAQGSTEQASAIEEITASIAEVNQDTKNNADDANNAEELIETALQNVISGSDKMNSMMKAIKDINTSSENISKIIKTIDDIAFQTNILALNAAVEAARAGEAGRGFAVVAEEVRNLAAKSAEAASETAELIESSIKITEVGTQIAGETSEMFEKITSNVKSTAEIVSKIAQASKNQVTTLEQIDIAIDQVSQVIQNNSSIAEVCADASSDLANRSNEMQQLIMKYKLNV